MFNEAVKGFEAKKHVVLFQENPLLINVAILEGSLKLFLVNESTGEPKLPKFLDFGEIDFIAVGNGANDRHDPPEDLHFYIHHGPLLVAHFYEKLEAIEDIKGVVAELLV